MKKNRIFASLVSVLLLVGAMGLGTSFVKASGCSDPVRIEDSKNRFLSMSGCKDKPNSDCVIVRCPIIIK